MLLLLGGEEVPVVGGEAMSIMVVAVDTLMVAAVEDEIGVMEEAEAKEAVPLDVELLPDRNVQHARIC